MAESDDALHVLRDGPCDGPENMARDEHLLYSPLLRPAALRIYAWTPPTLSLGCFQRFAALADLPDDVRALAVVRRPTGGGAILHDREVTYCLALDAAHPLGRAGPATLYERVHAVWRDVLLAADGIATELAPAHFPLPTPRDGPFFCFAQPGRTDLLLAGRKLLGSAQRRLPTAVLQHGSLILGNRFAAHPAADLGGPGDERVAALIDGFVAGLAAALELAPRVREWRANELADVARRRARYASVEWTRRR